MNGLETLRAKLLEMGATKNQVESRVVELTITALAGEQESNTEYLLKLLDEVKTEYKQKAEIAEYAKKQHDSAYEELQRNVKAQEVTAKKVSESVDRLDKMICQMIGLLNDIYTAETPEMRDRMRAVEILKANSHINTCYDNTAFIKALGNILSGDKEPDEPKQDYEQQKKARNTQAQSKANNLREELADLRKRLHTVTVRGVTYRI